MALPNEAADGGGPTSASCTPMRKEVFPRVMVASSPSSSAA